ncbi:MAG TPA: hypothetical protein DDX92_09240 [Flavobacteriales bacterium]|jgi:uncharacterized protein (TIGR02231 family)|nr:hypothetical protein [Flavobacteriales bacterium]
MRKNQQFIITFSLLFALLSIDLTAQNLKPIYSQIKKVTVYPSGAQVNREAKAYISQGRQTLAFDELSSHIDQQSIRVGGNGDYTILSVSYENYYPYEVNEPERIQALRDSLRQFHEEKQRLIGRQGNLKSERELVLANKQLTNDEEAVKVEELKAMAGYFREHLAKLTDLEIDTKRDLQETEKNIQRIQAELNNQTSWQNTRKGKILVEVDARSGGNITMQLDFFVRMASWTPHFDVFASDKGELNVKYFANIVQNTGSDWKRASITLSTSQPQMNSNVPVLYPWWLNWGPKQYEMYKAYPVASEQVISMDMEYEEPAPDVMEDDMSLFNKEANVSMASFSENMLNTEFTLERLFDVPSDGKPHKAALKEVKMSTELSYTAIPKLDKDAFLVASLSDWEAYDFISGNANLFFNNTYVGQAYIDAGQTVDTLELPLGRDNHITIKREKIKDLSGNNTIGSSIKSTRTYEIKVKNTNRKKVGVTVKDQYPLSSHKDVSVKLLESEGAVVNDQTGVLTWKMDLEPGEEKTVKFAFEVKYPKKSDYQIGNF